MKRRVARWGAILGMAALLCFLSGCGTNKTPIAGVQMHAQLQADGGLAVTEQIEYTLSPRVRNLTHVLEAPEVTDVSVSARPARGETTYFAQQTQGQLGQNGTFVMEQADATRTVLSLFHQFPDGGGTVYVTYRYTLRGLTQRYSDAGTLTWDLLGSNGWEVPIARWSMRLSLPIRQEGRLDIDVIRAPKAAVWNRTTDGIQISAQNVRAGARAQVQLDFAPELLVYVTPQAGPPLANLRAERQADTRHTLLWGISWGGGCLLLMLALGAWYYLRVDRDPRVPRVAAERGTLGITAPAELSTLIPLAGGVRKRDVVAMLLHLIHRNHLALVPPPAGLPLSQHTMDQVRIARRPAPRDTLLDGEFFLIHWFIDTLGDGQSVSLGAIRNGTRDPLGRDFRVWKRLVNEQIAQRPWFETLSPYREILAAIGGIMAIASVIVARTMAAPLAYCGLGAGVLLVAYALRMRRRTPAAAQEVARWKNLQAKIHKGDVHSIQTIAQWERILLYAQALGLGKQAAVAMQRALNAQPHGEGWPDAREATFLAWPLLEYGRQLPQWFDLFCRSAQPGVHPEQLIRK